MSDPTPDSRTSPSPPAADDPRVSRVRTLALTEDWAATIVGLAIIALVLVGLWPGWLVP